MLDLAHGCYVGRFLVLELALHGLGIVTGIVRPIHLPFISLFQAGLLEDEAVVGEDGRAPRAPGDNVRFVVLRPVAKRRLVPRRHPDLVLHAHVVRVVQVVRDLRLEGSESYAARDVVDRDASVGIPEVRLRDRIEPLLAGGIPQLQLDDVAVDLHLLDLEVHSNGAALQRIEHVLRKAQEHRGLARSRVAQHYYLVKRGYLVGFHLLRIEGHATTKEPFPLRFLVQDVPGDRGILTVIRLGVLKIMKLIIIVIL